MELIKNILSLSCDFGITAEDSNITDKPRKGKPTCIIGFGHYGNPDFRFDLALTYGNPENFLQVKKFDSANATVVGRGLFEKAHKISVLLKFQRSDQVRTVIIISDKKNRAVISDDVQGFDLDPSKKNSHDTRFELRFTVANHELPLYGTGFAVSEPGSDDDGVAFFLSKKKLIVMIDEAIRKAQKLRGNRRLVTALNEILAENGLNAKEENHEF